MSRKINQEISCGMSDTLQTDTINKITTGEGFFDLVIGNPPYKKTELNIELKELMTSFDITPGKHQKYCSSDLIFLLKGLLTLKDGGYLIYIMPDGFFTNIKNEASRKLLAMKYSIEHIIEIPEKSFSYTEAKTHILALRKSAPKKQILISSIMHKKEISIDVEDFIKRSDYSYYTKPNNSQKKTISEFNIEIIRGKKTKKYLESCGELFIHTSDIRKNKTLDFKHIHKGNEVTAKKGDIVLARVGTRAIGYFSIIKNGEIIISDCVLIIRCHNEEVYDRLIKTLNSKFGTDWLRSISKGVGAKHISKFELSKMPIL